MIKNRVIRWLSVVAVLAAIGLGLALFGEGALRRAALLIASNPVPATDANLALGADLFAQHCAACHGDPGDPQRDRAVIAGRLVPDFADLNRPASVLAMRITFGVGEAMPAWDQVLSSDEIWHLVTYVASFQGAGGGWRSRGN